jgi:predicted permease
MPDRHGDRSRHLRHENHVIDPISRLTAATRHAARQLLRAPVFALTLIVTLAIGIASATAIFTVARGVLLRPLPFVRPDELVAIQEYRTDSPGGGQIARANLDRYRASRVFESVTAFSYTELTLSEAQQAERVIGAAVDADFADVMGVRPVIGRSISRIDLGETPARVAVIADALWERRYHRDTATVGRSIAIDGEPYIVIGVMSPSFEFPRNPAMNRDVEVWVPREAGNPMMDRRGTRYLTAIARTAKTVSLRDAQTQLDAIASVAASDDARVNEGWRSKAVPLRESMTGAVRPAIVALAWCVAVLLLIAWTNATAAVLARVSLLRQAFEVRLALGGTIARVRRLVLSELLVAAMIALCVSIPLSGVLRHGLLRVAPVAIPRIAGVTLDAQALTFAAALALFSALFIALAAAMWLSRLQSTSVLSSTARTVAGSAGRTRAIGAFITIQIALGTSLLGVTSRMYAGNARLNRIDPGFAAEDVTTATIPLRGMRYRSGQARSMLTSRLLERVRTMPGVEHAAVTSLLPLSGGLMSSAYAVEGLAGDSSTLAALRAVSDDFFATFGIPVEGRSIASTDDRGSPGVVVINRALARQSFRESPAIGSIIRVRPPGADSVQAFRIVGISGNALERDLTGPAMPMIYFSDRQASFPHTVLAMKTSGPAPVRAIRTALQELDPTLALDDVTPLSSRVRGTYSLQIFVLALLVMFAASAATLIAIGVYGSVSFVVAAEMRAIGVRIALGATPMAMLASVVGRAAACGALGAAVGLVAVAVVPRALGLEPVVGTNHAAALVGAGATMLITAAASAIPGWRASTADPVTVLRS